MSVRYCQQKKNSNQIPFRRKQLGGHGSQKKQQGDESGWGFQEEERRIKPLLEPTREHIGLHRAQQSPESGWGFQEEERRIKPLLEPTREHIGLHRAQQSPESGWGFQTDEASIEQILKHPKQLRQKTQYIETNVTQCQCTSASTGKRCRIAASKVPGEDPRFCSRYHQNCEQFFIDNRPHKEQPHIRQRKQNVEQYLYQSLDEMMSAYGIPDARALTDLSDEEINYLIDHIMLRENTIKLSDLLKNVDDMDIRIKRLVIELAGKLCRCLEKVEKTAPKGKVGICIKNVFHGKGLTIASHTCNPPMLKPAPFPLEDPSMGPKLVLKKKNWDKYHPKR